MCKFFSTFDAFRNQLAFGLLGIAALLLLMRRHIFNVKQVLAIGAIAALIPVLEFAQIWMPARHVDVDDVLNGWLGLGLACLLYLAARGFWKIVAPETSRNSPCDPPRGALRRQALELDRVVGGPISQKSYRAFQGSLRYRRALTLEHSIWSTMRAAEARRRHDRIPRLAVCDCLARD